MYRRIRLSSLEWVHNDVRLLVTPRERFLGIRCTSGSPVLFYTRSVHTITLKRDTALCVLDRDGVVIVEKVLAPGRVVNLSERCWILEASDTTLLPAVGTTITATTIPTDDWKTRALRNTDREPWGSL